MQVYAIPESLKATLPACGMARNSSSPDVAATLDTEFIFNFIQNFGGAHFLGCFRISATTDARNEFADGLANGGDVAANWTILDPTSVTSTGGETFTASNSLMGSGPECSLEAFTTFQGKVAKFEFPRVTCSKLSVPLKNDDFMISDLDFEVFADLTGVPFRISQS